MNAAQKKSLEQAKADLVHAAREFYRAGLGQGWTLGRGNQQHALLAAAERFGRVDHLSREK